MVSDVGSGNDGHAWRTVIDDEVDSHVPRRRAGELSERSVERQAYLRAHALLALLEGTALAAWVDQELIVVEDHTNPQT